MMLNSNYWYKITYQNEETLIFQFADTTIDGQAVSALPTPSQVSRFLSINCGSSSLS